MESCEKIARRLQTMLTRDPSSDELEAALYHAWSHLTHVVQHWGEVVDAVGDDDLSIESFFEDDAQTDLGQEE
ncbi:MAG: hypothetical protein ACREJP_02270 [Candidatus Methylomirabilales bacterium]